MSRASRLPEPEQRVSTLKKTLACAFGESKSINVGILENRNTGLPICSVVCEETANHVPLTFYLSLFFCNLMWQNVRYSKRAIGCERTAESEKSIECDNTVERGMSIKYNRTVKSERTAENDRMRIDGDITFDSEIPNNHEIKNTSKNYFLHASRKGPNGNREEQLRRSSLPQIALSAEVPVSI